ncbi:septum site-determining protein Ssd [Brevibacterium album]|uniref:septum site-determining protein Ssd n=1 Tax=Brevibacterium album TaxID=417948 RepID=UPI000418EBF3|nr:septum site-determining protein Ssd [Brevibacterium album]
MSRIALISQLPSLMEQCAALADGAGIRLDVLAPSGGGWQDAVLVLLGEDIVLPPAGITAPTALIGTSAADAWTAAARVGAEHVAVLPEAAEWLSQRMIAAVEPPVAPGTTVGVVPGCGGAGASVLAAALAMRGSREGLRTVLVDADPLGGGIDLLLGAESASGLRWPDLAESKGRLRPSTLVHALPQAEGVSLLSWDRTTAAEHSADVFDSVLAAAQQAFDFVVVDLPRHSALDSARACHHLVLVVPGRVRAAVGAARVAARLRGVHAGTGIVVRAPERGGIAAGDIASAIGVRLLAEMREDRGLAARADRGEGLLGPRRSSLSAVAGELLSGWFPGESGRSRGASRAFEEVGEL